MVAFGFWDSHISFVTMLLVTEIVHRGFSWKDSFLHDVDPVAVFQVNRASRNFSKHVKLLMSPIRGSERYVKSASAAWHSIMRFSTKAIHAGQDPDPATGSVTVPVYLTSTYMQLRPGREGKYVYSRTANPTRTALAESLAALEAGKVGLAFSSGLAATTTVLMLLRKGDHVIAGDDIYGGTYRLFDQVLRTYGLQFTYVNPRSPDKVEKAVRKNTKMIWIETPTNPLMRVVDIRAISRIATKNHAMLVVDNTFASPYLQNPLKLGADISVHSTTKYLGGHSDLIGGAAITTDVNVGKRLKFLQNAVGAVPGPLDC